VVGPKNEVEDGKGKRYHAKQVLNQNAQLGTGSTDWQYVRDTVMWYIEDKKAGHRFDGQGNFDMTKVPTWDLLSGKEVIE
jgi:hypothetical protein